MGRIVELPPIKLRSSNRRQGLRKLSPDPISKARDETATQVTRIGLTFLGTTAFCLLSLLSPDSALLGGSEKINVPFAGPVSFFGFMLLGPAVLIVLQGLSADLCRAQRPAGTTCTVNVGSAGANPGTAPEFTGTALQWPDLLSVAAVTMLLFAWKAAVFPAWGSGLFALR